MTEPDEALLWARVEYATLIRPFDVGPEQDYISKVILNGLWDDDVSIRHGARGYRAGAAASAERIKELKARVAELEERLKRFETMGHYPPTSTPGPWLLKESDQ